MSRRGASLPWRPRRTPPWALGPSGDAVAPAEADEATKYLCPRCCDPMVLKKGRFVHVAPALAGPCRTGFRQVGHEMAAALAVVRAVVEARLGAGQEMPFVDERCWRCRTDAVLPLFVRVPGRAYRIESDEIFGQASGRPPIRVSEDGRPILAMDTAVFASLDGGLPDPDGAYPRPEPCRTIVLDAGDVVWARPAWRCLVPERDRDPSGCARCRGVPALPGEAFVEPPAAERGGN